MKKNIGVSALLDDYKIIISAGSEDGIVEGAKVNVLSSKHAISVQDPFTGENLGKINHIKAKILIIEVKEKFSICIANQKNQSFINLQSSGLMPSFFSDKLKMHGDILKREITDEPIEVGDVVEL